MPGIQRLLQAITEDDEPSSFGPEFIRRPQGARFHKWKAAFMADMTVTVAEMMATPFCCDSTPFIICLYLVATILLPWDETSVCRLIILHMFLPSLSYTG